MPEVCLYLQKELIIRGNHWVFINSLDVATLDEISYAKIPQGNRAYDGTRAADHTGHGIDGKLRLFITIRNSNHFPYLVKLEGFHDGMEVWAAIIMTLSIGVFVGFIIALFQMIAQKSEVISLKSKVRRLKNELDNLRNNAIDDDIEIVDEIEEDSAI